MRDVFVHDITTGITERVSVDSTGAEGTLGSDDQPPAMSASGRYVAFASDASDLVAGDSNSVRDVFVHDRNTGITERVSVDSSGAEGNQLSDRLSISSDGRFVTFCSGAALVVGDTNGRDDIFVHDRQTSTTERVSVHSSGTEGNRNSSNPFINADGRFVGFRSIAKNLVPGDTNICDGFADPGTCPDIFVHDRQTSTTERVSVDSSGNQGNLITGLRSSISQDGRFVAFQSDASNLVPNDTNNVRDVFVHDRQTGETRRVSVNINGTEGNGDSKHSRLSGDGCFIVFSSESSNLVQGDSNGVRDIFVSINPLAWHPGPCQAPGCKKK